MKEVKKIGNTITYKSFIQNLSKKAMNPEVKKIERPKELEKFKIWADKYLDHSTKGDIYAHCYAIISKLEQERDGLKEELADYSQETKEITERLRRQMIADGLINEDGGLINTPKQELQALKDAVRLDLAEQQLLGYSLAKKEVSLKNLVISMGLTKKEWIQIKKQYELNYLSEDEFIEINQMFSNL